jgi:hypothetical protein
MPAVETPCGTEIVAIDNLPADIPITAREIEVVGAYLAGLIDELLGETPASGWP